MTIHKIPAANLDELQAKVAKLNKTAAKLGVSPIRCEVVDRLVETKSETDIFGQFVARREKVFFLVDVEGAAPKYAGWTFAATLEHTEAGNIVRTVPGTSLPEAYQTKAAWCDHCQSSRRRKDTFVVVHEDGSVKQIGRNCIRDFLGHQNPEMLATWLEVVVDTSGFSEYEDEDRAVRGPEKLNTYDVLVLAAAAIREHGWVSRQFAETSGATTTSARVRDHLDIRPGMKDYEKTRLHVVDADKDWASKTIVWVAENLTGSVGEYENNVRVTCAREYLQSRDIGIACSAVSYVQRRLEQLELRKQEQASKSNEYVGKVGDKLALDVTLVTQRVMGRQQYGYYDSAESYLYKFEDATGNLLTWFSSRDLDLTNGTAYRLSGTVKDLGGYNGRKETKMTRCKVATAVVA